MHSQADVAQERRVDAVAEDGDRLAGIRAVEVERVDTLSADDRVVALARSQLEAVVAGAEDRDLIAAAAEDVVVARGDPVVTLAAEDSGGKSLQPNTDALRRPAAFPRREKERIGA